jgi:3-oxoacyl-[acyl-carrier-protein] synthase II
MTESGRRVVITGMGAITPLGNRVADFFAGLVAGRSGIGPVTRFDAKSFPTRIAGEIKGFALKDYLPESQRWRHSGLNTQFTLAAAMQALVDAGLVDPNRGDRTRMGVYLGSGEGTQDFRSLMNVLAMSTQANGKTIDTRIFAREGLAQFDAAEEQEQDPHTTAAHLATAFELEGPNWCCLTACAASSQAIGESAEFIRRGDADVMLAGGSHSMIHPLGMTGFCLLGAMSKTNDAPMQASRPFDKDRDGFVLAEGGGIIVLESLEHAQKRRATIHAELTGYGTSADAFRMTDPPPDGRGAAIAMQLALQDARLNIGDIGYVNAHGTSTHAGDAAESRAIRSVFGTKADILPVSSTKSMTGHLVAAGGVIELIACILALKEGVLPPTINYDTPDPACDLDYVPNQARPWRMQHALTNNFGFGGQNTSLIISRFVN